MKKLLTILAIAFSSTISQGQTPQYEWAKGFGGPGDEKSNKVTLDPKGNIIVMGRFYSKEITLDSIKLINADQKKVSCDAFIAKYNPNGKVIWAKSFGGLSDDLPTHVATDKKGNIILSGGFDSDTMRIGKNLLINNTKRGDGSDVFLTKLSPNGEAIWARSFGNEKSDGGYDTFSIDNDGNIFYAGSYRSTFLMLDSIKLTNSSKESETYIAKFNPEGNALWAKMIQGANFDEPQSCSLDPKGNFILAGYFLGDSIIFESTILKNKSRKSEKPSPLPPSDIFVAKYSTNGKLLWAKSFGGYSTEVGTSKTDGAGNIYLAGLFADSIFTLGNIALRNSSALSEDSSFIMPDIFVAKLDKDGEVVWAKNAIGKSGDYTRTLYVNKKGDSFITGYFDSPSLDFQNYSITNTGQENFFIASYSSKGNFRWAKTSDGKGRNSGKNCIEDKDGNIYVTGYFQSTEYSFDTITLKNNGDLDVFIAKLIFKK